MKNQAVWKKYSGKVAWPTIFLFLGLLVGYGFLWFFYKNGLSGAWTSLIGASLAYGMFTIGHEACHGNISGGVQSFIVLEKALGWLSSSFLLFPYCSFAVIHLRHHAHTNDPVKDPDNYVNGKNALSIFLRCFTLIAHYFGLTFGKDSKKDPAMRAVRSQSILFTVLLLITISTLIVIGEGMALLYVFVLSALIAAPILAFSFDWIPHYPHNNLGKYHNTRVITVPGLEYVSLYQSYHLMHHLYPRVPFYKYKSCFQDYEKELIKERSPIEGFRNQDLGLFKKENTYADLISGKTWNYILEVENIFLETHDTVKITFKNLNNIPFAFKPGQYVVVSDYVENKLLSRCYSICEDPLTGKLAVAVKRVKHGKFSNHLIDNLKAGYKLRISGPYGSFILPDIVKAPVLLIAGGSGITPILSMLKTVLRTSNQQVTLLYGCRSAKDVIFEDEIKELEKVYKNRFAFLLSFKILNAEMQYQCIKDISYNTQCYICGPTPMMNASKVALGSIGISENQIKTEEFVYSQNELTGDEFEVKILGDIKATFLSDTSETLIEASLRHQKKLPHACRMGQCGTCKIKLIEGNVTWQKREGISLLQHEIDQGYILPCVCKPKTNVILKS